MGHLLPGQPVVIARSDGLHLLCGLLVTLALFLALVVAAVPLRELGRKIPPWAQPARLPAVSGLAR